MLRRGSTSFKDAIAVAKRGQFDAYVAVGGGSVMDTCKAANLYASHPEADFLDFVNAPIGKGKPVTRPVKPLFAGAHLCGTGAATRRVLTRPCARGAGGRALSSADDRRCAPSARARARAGAARAWPLTLRGPASPRCARRPRRHRQRDHGDGHL